MNEEANEQVISETSTQPGSSPLSSLLKSPGSLVQQIDKDQGLPAIAAQMLLWGLAFHAVYGFAMALFDSSSVALMAAWKAPLIACCSLLLCIPSLYVFSCVAGLPVSITQAVTLGSTTVAVTGLLLIGLTPVTWLFSVSTNSVGFVVVVNIIAWGIAVWFSRRFFSAMQFSDRLKRTSGLKWWLLIYIIVSLQMTTTMRPLLEKPESGWRATEKKFFLTHLKESFTEKAEKGGSDSRGASR